MTWIDGVISFIQTNGLTIFNSLLLITTAVLSFSSQIFQTRTSIRESLEQLEDVEFHREKLKPILHNVEYFPLLKGKSTVLLKYYQEGRNPASANKPLDLFTRTLNKAGRVHSDNRVFTKEKAYSGIKRTLNEVEGVTVSRVDESGIYLEIPSADSVVVRERTDAVLTRLRELHTTSTSKFVEQHNIEGVDPSEV
ncbi:hypothetical protein OB920_13210 [Halobacteria archaeon HArc-gm2]|nr:hypothetical protein [Halobacteria archaeon HArc-gm2]